jgi:predicted metal-dependent hydrolase
MRIEQESTMAMQARETATAPRARHPDRAIRPRNPELGFAGLPRHWFAGSAVATHIVNGVNLLFPAGERFFIRSVRHYLDRIADDPVLTAQVRGFFAQEGRHAGAHERFFAVLEGQGYEIEGFLRAYEKSAYAFIEKMSTPALRLSATVALEHFTAIMAEDALAGDVLAEAHPAMRKLLMWHAAEEIEHKAVAFDVLAKVSPGYPLRMAGMAIAIAMLGGFWIAATGMLLRQDGVTPAARRAELAGLRDRDPIAKRVFLRGIREYVRRDFHPSDNDNYHLAREFLASEGLG